MTFHLSGGWCGATSSLCPRPGHVGVGPHQDPALVVAQEAAERAGAVAVAGGADGDGVVGRRAEPGDGRRRPAARSPGSRIGEAG